MPICECVLSVCGIFVCGTCMCMYGWVCLCTHTEAAAGCQASVCISLCLYVEAGPLPELEARFQLCRRASKLSGSAGLRLQMAGLPRHVQPRSAFGMLGN